MTAKKATLGSLIDQLFALKKKLSEKEQEKKEIEEKVNKLKDQIIARGQEEGVSQARGKLGTATINDKTYPQVTDWDAFYKFIHENKFYQLLHRRPSVPGCAELFDTQGSIPGVEKFVKREVNLKGL